MATRAPIRKSDHRRRCLYCGFAGLSVQIASDATSFRCPSCGGDLYSRPPRTYLELEGFVAPAAAEKPRGVQALLARILGLYTAIRLSWRRRTTAGEAVIGSGISRDRAPSGTHGPRPRSRRSQPSDDRN